ncbi:hypothetical protein QBC37DRAFT_374791 [Rhypophila decipiens]|uniref:Uncharacterized protein n=1 Tax=Rhypophila decipiens TaxID=261697 RepID=A0AAN6Y585_9PEZI|nr:hypothetical protein QBC37DRAFT_374791 [Rhypophila decipiens]
MRHADQIDYNEASEMRFRLVARRHSLPEARITFTISLEEDPSIENTRKSRRQYKRQRRSTRYGDREDVPQQFQVICVPWALLNDLMMDHFCRATDDRSSLHQSQHQPYSPRMEQVVTEAMLDSSPPPGYTWEELGGRPQAQHAAPPLDFAGSGSRDVRLFVVSDGKLDAPYRKLLPIYGNLLTELVG